MLQLSPRVRLLLLSALIVLSMSAGRPRAAAEPDLPGALITLAPSDDTYITNLHPESNFGSAGYLELWYRTLHLSPYGAFLLLRFEVQEALDPAAIIDSATLELYQIEEGSGPDPVSVMLHPILEAWREETVTWTNQPTVYTGPFVLAADLSSAPGWKQIDLTRNVQGWLTGDNYGIELRGPNALFQRVFESRDHHEREPRLVIRYHLPSPTPVPTQVATPTPTPTPTPEEDVDLADLRITDIWPDDEAICVQLLNGGDAPNEQPAALSLTLDGQPWASLAGPAGLRPGERWRGCFARSYGCTPLFDQVQAEVDAQDVVPELDERNNRREERWACDQMAPLFVEGPIVEDLGQNSAAVVWVTDEKGDSQVQIGRAAGEFSGAAAEETLVTRHRLVLRDLQPGTTYHGVARSADAGGNLSASAPFFFTTLPPPDSQRPSVSLRDPGLGRGLLRITAAAADDQALSRVEFWLDNRLLFTACSPPYALTLDTRAYANGSYELQARAVDRQGNTAVDARRLAIDNPLDARAPQVTILAPGAADPVRGDVTIKAAMQDDRGLAKAVFYVEGANVHAQNLSGEKETVWQFTWDSTTVKNGWRRLGVQLFDSEGKEGAATVDVLVDNPAAARPLLALATHQATQTNNRLAILLVVENIGGAPAQNVHITDTLAGFAPQAGSAGARASWVGPFFALAIDVQGSIAPGEKRYFAFTAVPALEYPGAPQPAIGEPLFLEYKNAAGTKYFQRLVAPITRTTGGVSLAEARAQAIKSADYLVVTDPWRLDANYGLAVHDILETMGRLALARNGVIGLVKDVHYLTLDRLLTPPGNNLLYDLLPTETWAEQLHPNFSKPLQGYLLLVGETEILPAPDLSVSGLNNGAPYSDHVYSDTGGDGRPELIVGRIIGDDAQTIRAPMEAAISNRQGEAGHEFAYESALLISGPPAGSFVSDVQGVGQILRPRLSNVDFLHADAYFQADAFQPRDKANKAVPHDSADGLAAGHMLGGSQEDVVLASKAQKTAYIFDRQGLNQVQFHIPVFDGTDHDLLAVGNVRGDKRAELIIGDRDSNRIFLYDHGGTAVSHPFNLAGNWAMEAGDIDNDGMDELLLANTQGNKIWIGDGDPLLFTSFSRSFDQHDRLLAADILGDDGAEIVLIDWSANSIIVLDSAGKQLIQQSFGSKGGGSWLNYIGKGSRFTAGAVYDGVKDQIVIAPLQNYPERVFSYYYNDSSKKFISSMNTEFGFTFRPGHILAGGQVFRDSSEDTHREEIIIATGDNWIRILDLENFSERLQPDLEMGVRDRDIIFYSGHGDVNTWDRVVDTHVGTGVPMNFGDHHPVIFALACLSGNYQWGSSEHENIAETLLGDGAAVYIGATEKSWGYTNREAANWLFHNWMKGESIGSAFTRLERAVWDRDPLGATGYTVGWHSWIRQHNLYGDPKFGAPLSTAVEQPALPQSPAAPPPSLTVDIPAYEVRADAFGPGLDDVFIPGGRLWLEPGRLRLPYQTAVYALPAGVTVEAVRLHSRENYSEEMGVVIPITAEDAPSCSCLPEPHPGSGDGVEPGKIYEWEVLEEADGTSMLVIRIFPIQYNPRTTALQFWSSYRFSIDYGESLAKAAGVNLSDDQPDPGSPLNAEILVDNAGDPADFVVEGALYAAGDGRLVYGPPLVQLKRLQGTGALLLPLETGGLAPGEYTLRLLLRDEKGRLLSIKRVGFHLGTADLTIERFDASPRPVQPRRDVRLQTAVRSSGAIATDGVVTLSVRTGAGRQVASFRHPFTALAPGETRAFLDNWPGADVGEEEYWLLVSVEFGGQTRQALLPLSRLEMREVYLPAVRGP